MNVTQLLQRLSYGPLANLSMSNDGDGTIVETKHPAVIGFANECLLKLYSKFNLKEAEVIIEQAGTITNYKLDSKYSLVNAAANPTLPHYIIDSVTKPFTDDLIKVLGVYQTGGAQAPLNDDNASNSLFTPTYDLLQVPDPEDGAPLYIIYQAKHAPLALEGEGYLDADIDLPEVLEEALIAYIGHKVYFYMNGQENTLKSSDYLSIYTSICNEAVDQDLVSTSLSETSKKFNDRGFC
jgi:hypothetical protein